MNLLKLFKFNREASEQGSQTNQTRGQRNSSFQHTVVNGVWKTTSEAHHIAKPESLHSPFRIAGAKERTSDPGIEQLQRWTGLDASWSFVLVNGAALADQQIHQIIKGASFNQPDLQRPY